MTAPFAPIQFAKEGGMLVSIVVPMHGMIDLTQRCLQTLFEWHDYSEIEVIVVDDASPSLEWPANMLGADEVVTLVDRGGFARACNAGLEIAKGAFTVFLNNDTETFRPWLWDLIKPLQERPGVGVVGALLLYPGKTPRRVQHAGMVFAGRHMPVHAYRGQPEDGPAGIHRPKSLQAVTAACMAVRTEEFRGLGGFCEDFASGYEDLDLCFKYRFTLGKLVWYEPAAQLIHIECATPGRRAHEDANNKLFAERWSNRVQVDYKAIMEADAKAAAGRE